MPECPYELIWKHDDNGNIYWELVDNWEQVLWTDKIEDATGDV